MAPNEYLSPEHALAYLAKADGIPHRTEGEAVLISFVPTTAQRILDLGNRRRAAAVLLHAHCPAAHFVGLDFSPTMLQAANSRFKDDPRVEIRQHDLDNELPADRFDVVVFSFRDSPLLERPQTITLRGDLRSTGT